MYPILALALTAGVGFGGYLLARNFVSRRLRFVDAIQSPWAPWIAGALGALAFSPLTLLPWLGLVTTAVFGLGIGFGTASGVRAIRRGELVSRRLIP
ncbi:MAG TPA: hypothetical protein VK688_01250 [Gemmatimonadales bacterium]|jgi:hypothetical protein|nr:hypothetical protein [Gemmatimonadales bacterium]